MCVYIITMWLNATIGMLAFVNIWSDTGHDERTRTHTSTGMECRSGISGGYCFWGEISIAHAAPVHPVSWWCWRWYGNICMYVYLYAYKCCWPTNSHEVTRVLVVPVDLVVNAHARVFVERLLSLRRHNRALRLTDDACACLRRLCCGMSVCVRVCVSVSLLAHVRFVVWVI